MPRRMVRAILCSIFPEMSANGLFPDWEMRGTIVIETGSLRNAGPFPGGGVCACFAGRVICRLSDDSLVEIYEIQGFRVSGMYAVSQVVWHFAYHTGQIIFITKWKLGKDLRFTYLPGEKRMQTIARVP